MTVGEVIQRIQSLYSKGNQSDDSRLTPRHIYNKMLTLRSKLLTQKAKKRQFLNDWNYNIIPCVELIKVDAHSCPCLPAIGCKVYRTKHPLPKPLTNYSGHIIDWVLSIEGSIKIDEISREDYRNIKGNKYTSNDPRYIIEDNYLFFYGKSLPKVVKIKLLVEDPIEAEMFPSLCPGENTECEECNECESPMDKEFSLDLDMIDTMVEMAVNELVIMFSQSTEDLTNNTRDNITEQSK